MIAKAQEVMGPHGLEDAHLVDEEPLHLDDPSQEPGRLAHAVGVEVLDGRVRLVEDELEPELVDLMDDDEERLVVMSGRGLALLEGEQFRNLQVLAIG
jgi:hypothetical protein